MKCLMCKRTASPKLIGSANEGLCSWCNSKHPVSSDKLEWTPCPGLLPNPFPVDSRYFN
jgi:hypothetical protein